jgi:hypothetical protein
MVGNCLSDAGMHRAKQQDRAQIMYQLLFWQLHRLKSLPVFLNVLVVMPVKLVLDTDRGTGIQDWIPAFAGMTH